MIKEIEIPLSSWYVMVALWLVCRCPFLYHVLLVAFFVVFYISSNEHNLHAEDLPCGDSLNV